jgi:hypothetical protein
MLFNKKKKRNWKDTFLFLFVRILWSSWSWIHFRIQSQIWILRQASKFLKFYQFSKCDNLVL